MPTRLPRHAYSLLLILLTGLLGAATACTLPQDQTAPEPQPGPFEVLLSEVTIHRPDGGCFRATICGPNGAGADTVLTYPLPAIVFGHGFVQPPQQYDSTLRHLASRGYLVIAPLSALEPFPSHQQLADDLRNTLTWLEQQNEDSASEWFGRIDVAHLGLLGHSMGGGAAVLAAAADTRVKAMAAMAPAETRPSAVAAASGVTAPALFLLGTADTYVPSASNGLAMYDRVAGPRVAVLIDGGFHCGFVDVGIAGCDSGGISRTAQLDITWDRLTAFFDCYLKGSAQARDDLVAPADGVELLVDLP